MPVTEENIMDKLIARVAELTSEGIYAPGQYTRQGGLSASALTTHTDGSMSFSVFTTFPNMDRETVKVTISRP
jgi:hypothetical protein